MQGVRPLCGTSNAAIHSKRRGSLFEGGSSSSGDGRAGPQHPGRASVLPPTHFLMEAALAASISRITCFVASDS